MRSTCRSFALAALALLVAVPALSQAKSLEITKLDGSVVRCRWRNPAGAPATIDRCEVVVPPPLPTAAPTPSPSPTPDIDALCDVMLTYPASKTDRWFGHPGNVEIPEGVTIRFCAPIMPPLIDYHPSKIEFSWYDVTDQDCGALNVHVDATDGFSRPRGGTGFSASGSYYYYGKIGSRLFPEQTAPGLYVITATGGPTACARYRIAWKATP